MVGALPAAQNLIVAARSRGLGTTFTTFQMFIESELRELLGIPKEIKFGVMIPIGWPKNDFVKVKRKPISKVIRQWRFSHRLTPPTSRASACTSTAASS